MIFLSNNNEKNNLLDELKQYSTTGTAPFHMPGHKRNLDLLGNKLPYNIDITEIYGFDNLHHCTGILKNITEKAKKVFHSKHCYMLINGSTCGILAAIRTVTSYGDEIIIARNCHKSVYNGCSLNNLKVHYIYPDTDPNSDISMDIKPESVLDALQAHPKSKAVLLTSPTYEGVISDIKKIAELTHSFDIPLIVDNAHGAHQHFCKTSVGEPVECGADIVISSLHKTLPSLTQTAIAHINSDIVDCKEFENQLAIFETSSPSYILMASIDQCMDFLLNSQVLFEKYEDNLRRFSEKMKNLKNLSILCMGDDKTENHGFFSFDLGKIVISTKKSNISGAKLADILRENYSIEIEMAYSSYAVAMTSVCDTQENFARLEKALRDIDTKVIKSNSQPFLDSIPKLEQSSFSSEQIQKLKNGELKDFDSAVGSICMEYIFAYPPGIPLVVPAEFISKELIDYIKALRISGIEILKTKSGAPDKIFCKLEP